MFSQHVLPMVSLKAYTAMQVHALQEARGSCLDSIIRC
jgi:hypothetical protein